MSRVPPSLENSNIPAIISKSIGSDIENSTMDWPSLFFRNLLNTAHHLQSHGSAGAQHNGGGIGEGACLIVFAKVIGRAG